MLGRLFALCLLASLALGAPLWGHSGHEITATVATGLLSSTTAEAVAKVLQGETLTDVSTWADRVKHESEWEWSAKLHFVNTPAWACDYVHGRDCPDNECVVGAIQNYTSRLYFQTGGDEQVQISLKFLTHFMGDIHQPLHCGFESDRGGNDISVTYNGDHDNLHAVWDSSILYEREDTYFNRDQNQYASWLLTQVNGDWASKAASWAACPNNASAIDCPSGWANVSVDLACEYSYTDSHGEHIENGAQLGDDYFNFTYPIVDEQLAKGGVRLAAALNRLYDPDFEMTFPMPDWRRRAHEAVTAPRKNAPLRTNKVVARAPMWGHTGHQITAAVAQQLLSASTLNKVNSILAGDSMEYASTWADHVKHDREWIWSKDLHFVNTPEWACNYHYDRDCVNGQCIVGALQNYTQRLSDSTLTDEERTVALKFIIHFMGDLHQPMHVSFTEDLGGNTIKGHFFGESGSLHYVWDAMILERRISNDFHRDDDDYTAYLHGLLMGEWSSKASQWRTQLDPNDLASETLNLACTYGYVDAHGKHVPNNFELDTDYYDRNAPIVDEQLAKGGVRLAALLENILGDM